MRTLKILLFVLALVVTAGCINPLAPLKNASPSPSPGPIGAPEISANLSAGYQKVFAVSLDGVNYTKTETHPGTFIYRIEDRTGNLTIYVDENNSVLKVTHDNETIRYNNPLPVVMYPLAEGKMWSYASNLTLQMNDRSIDGNVTINATVVGFENVTISYASLNQTANAAYQGNHTYLAARVNERTITNYSVGGTNYTISNQSTKWFAQDLGLIKINTISKTFIGSFLDQVSEDDEVLIEFSS